MKKLGLILGALLLNFTGISQEKKGTTLTITIENVLSDEGAILASLHTSTTFMKGAGISNAAAPATKGSLSLIFENVQPGTFAFMVMHDTNDNKRMDMAANGMPKENYATSGGSILYGPPTFEAAKFEVTDTDQTFTVRF